MRFASVNSASVRFAAAAAKTAKPWVELDCGMVGEKLAVQVTNSCCEEVAFKNDIPQSGRAGHGLVTYSIAELAEKHGGTADFSCREGYSRSER
jgi:hypothetical protein